MRSNTLKRYAPLALALGLAALLAAAAIWLVQRQWTPYVQASAALGLLGLALAMLLNPEAVQVWLAGRQARYGGNVLIMTLAMLGILGLINYLAYKNPQQWDLTEGQQNTLAPESVAALTQLPGPVRAVGFYTAESAASRERAQNLLEQYKRRSDGKFDYVFYDPLRDPTRAQAYNISRDATLFLELGENREEVAFASEEEITGGLARLSNPGERKVYFLTGHGEADLSAGGNRGLSQVTDVLRNQDYELLSLNLQVTNTVPADARALVIAGPEIPLTAEEVGLIKGYVDGGGSLVVMLDPPLEAQSAPDAADPLVDYLSSSWGVTVRRDVIVDLTNYAFINNQPQPYIPVVTEYGPSQITSRLQNVASMFPLARSVATPETGSNLPEVSYTHLVSPSDTAWGETNFDSLSTGNGPVQEEGDTAAPLHIGVSAQNTATNARLVVFGDSDFATDGFAQAGGNAGLFTGSVNWATVEESLINITPKIPTTRRLGLVNATTVNAVFLVTVVAMPLSVLILGGVVWWQRRRHV